MGALRQTLVVATLLFDYCVLSAYFKDPPSHGDLVLTKDNSYLCISVAPDGIESPKYVLPVCGDNIENIDNFGFVISRHLGYKTCTLSFAENTYGIAFGTRGIKCSGSESHILRCQISSPRISNKYGCKTYIRVSCPLGNSLYSVLNTFGTITGNKAYHGQALLYPSSPTSRGYATASMGLVAVKEVGETCNYWRFIEIDGHVDLTLSTTLCRQMGFTHVSAVMSKNDAEIIYGMDFSFWLPLIGPSTIPTSDIKCGEVSHECLSCCNYTKHLSCPIDDQFSTSLDNSLLVLRCSFYEDGKVLSEGGLQCANQGDASKATCYRPSFGDVRLQDGDATKGRIEYYQNHEWHTICSVGFDQKEADLVCERLGFVSSDKFGNASSLGIPTGSQDQPIYRLSCIDNSPSNCSVHDCGNDHSLDVAVICKNEGDFRLQGGKASKGRLEYYHSSKWHTISSVGFQKEEADLICKRLGFDSCDKYGNVSSLRVQASSDDLPIYHLSCQNDSSTMSCSVHSLSDDHARDVAIACNVKPFKNWKVEVVLSALGVVILISWIIIIVIILKWVRYYRNRRAGYENVDPPGCCCLQCFFRNQQDN